MVIKAIIFDMAGVLLRSVFKSSFALELQQKLGVSQERFISARKNQWYKFARGEIDEETFWRRFLAELGVKEDYKQLSKRIYNSFEAMPATLDLLKELKRHYRLAILSNSSREWGDYCVKKYLFNKLFDAIILSCNEGITKPAPDIFLIAAERLGVTTAECVFIDDKQTNVDAARSVGMIGIRFESPGQLREELMKVGVKL
ncbi:HAD family phosphatase [Candidatus Woesearchaeota archaeon]|nr:HAD family phosphatase [Candidatus Woesearchaeota archaeon]